MGSLKLGTVKKQIDEKNKVFGNFWLIIMINNHDLLIIKIVYD